MSISSGISVVIRMYNTYGKFYYSNSSGQCENISSAETAKILVSVFSVDIKTVLRLIPSYYSRSALRYVCFYSVTLADSCRFFRVLFFFFFVLRVLQRQPEGRGGVARIKLDDGDGDRCE